MASVYSRNKVIGIPFVPPLAVNICLSPASFIVGLNTGLFGLTKNLNLPLSEEPSLVKTRL